MKKSKISFWLVIIIGTLGILASIYTFLDGQDFHSYFWGGFCGITLIGTALINKLGKNIIITKRQSE